MSNWKTLYLVVKPLILLRRQIDLHYASHFVDYNCRGSILPEKELELQRQAWNHKVGLS